MGLRVLLVIKVGFGGPRRFGRLDAQSSRLDVWFRVVEKTFG